MIKGVSNFNPKPIQGSALLGFSQKSEEQLLDQTIKNINEASAIIREWQTLMNIFAMKGWEDPLTGDVHIVLKYSKIAHCDHIGDAVEKVEENK